MYTKARFSTFVPFTCLCHCVQPCILTTTHENVQGEKGGARVKTMEPPTPMALHLESTSQ